MNQFVPQVHSERQLQRAVASVTRSWFPVNPVVVERIQARFFSEGYRNARVELIEDLRGDASLYLLCLRSVMTLLKERSQPFTLEGIALEGVSDELLEKALGSVLRLRLPQLSAHSIESISLSQQRRLEELLLSTVTAHTLARQLARSPEVTYGCALLRQLGVTLVAWNYPHVYAQGLDALKGAIRGSAHEFDSFLHSTLGFSPAMLGARLVEEWGGGAEIVQMVRTSVPDESGDGSKRWRRSRGIAELCSIGEAFARANAPERYPTAKDDWQTASISIRAHLGKDGIQKVYRRVREVAEKYHRACPELVEVLTERERSVDLSQPNDLFARNIHLTRCAPELRQRFARVYGMKEKGMDSSQLLQLVLDDVIPVLGCSGLAIFTFDPVTDTLTPVLARERLRSIRLKPVSLHHDGTVIHPLRLAFEQSPHIAERAQSDGANFTLLAGSIGYTNRVAVLATEWVTAEGAAEDDQHRESQTESREFAFHALRQCLADMLGVE